MLPYVRNIDDGLYAQTVYDPQESRSGMLSHTSHAFDAVLTHCESTFDLPAWTDMGLINMAGAYDSHFPLTPVFHLNDQFGTPAFNPTALNPESNSVQSTHPAPVHQLYDQFGTPAYVTSLEHSPLPINGTIDHQVTEVQSFCPAPVAYLRDQYCVQIDATPNEPLSHTANGAIDYSMVTAWIKSDPQSIKERGDAVREALELLNICSLRNGEPR